MKESIYQQTRQKLTQCFNDYEHSTNNLSKVMAAIYRKNYLPNSFHFLSSNIRKHLQGFSWDLPTIHTLQKSSDGTIKFLIRFSDGKKVECVLLDFYQKYTLCLSSQVGCAMKCQFCFTGMQGLERNLQAFEIIGQYLAITRWLKQEFKRPNAITNLVFMGQGEPLHNIDAVIKAVEIFCDPLALALSPKNLTISTSGLLPALKKARLHPILSQINFAFSLHSTIKARRDQLIPLNKNYPLEEIIDELAKFKLRKKQAIQFEYLLIDGFNDDQQEIENLKNLIGHLDHMLNIIPYNPVPGLSFKRPTAEKTKAFQQACAQLKIRTMIRTTRGDDILAACGQLSSKRIDS